jgi:hypothetical protein
MADRTTKKAAARNTAKKSPTTSRKSVATSSAHGSASQKLFNADLGSKWRAIDFRKGDNVDNTALKALLREAVAYNTTHSVPRKGESRSPAGTGVRVVQC